MFKFISHIQVITQERGIGLVQFNVASISLVFSNNVNFTHGLSAMYLWFQHDVSKNVVMCFFCQDGKLLCTYLVVHPK
jgi:hypothetical protein